MEKVLSISIAAYNAEKTINRALESCLNPHIANKLEIFVIDDGGTDRTLEIASEYEKRYPESVKLVHKDNGGYGSTVNRAIELASGRYFRLLDGDDWLDFDNMPQYIEILENSDADMILTRMMYEYIVSGQSKVSDDNWAYYIDKNIRLEEMQKDVFAGMWEVTYRTELLKRHLPDLPEHTLYTDHIFIMKPIPFIESVLCKDIIIYHYCLENDGQSVSIDSRKKHSEEIIRVSEILNSYFAESCRDNKNWKYAAERARRCYMEAFRTQLLFEKSSAVKNRIKEMEIKLKQTDMELYRAMTKDSRRLLFYRLTNYWGYYFK